MVPPLKGVREGSPLPKKKGSIGMKLKKILGVFALSAVLVCSLGGVVGCSNTEQLIRDSLTEEIDQYKNVDESAIEEIDQAIPATQMEMLGLNSEELAKAILSGFDGTVDSVTVNGDKAEAIVTITSKSLSNMESELTDIISDAQDAPELKGKGLDDIYKWCGQKMMEYINNAPVETHEPITVEYVKNGNTWAPTAASTNEMQSVIFG